MNNPRSMVLGWVSLITVAGVSFYFAKQSINERRRQQDLTGRERVARDQERTQTAQAPRKEHSNIVPSPDPDPRSQGVAGSPARQTD